MKKKWVVILVVIVVLIGFGGWFGYRYFMSKKDAKNHAVEVTKAEFRDIEQFVECTGEISPERMTEIKSEVNGLISEIKAIPGDQVTKGQALVEIDRRELESEVKEASLRIELTELRFEKARLDWQRKVKLFEQKLITGKEFEDARIDSSLAEKEFHLEQARLETLKQKLLKTTILAPHEGMVLNVDVQEGSVIVGANSFSAGTVLMKVADLSQLRVKTDLNEVDVAKVSMGMLVNLTVDSIPGLKIEGKLTFVSPSAVSKEKEKDIRGFPITVSFPAPDLRIRPGMTANLKMIVTKAAKAVSLPTSAVFLEEDENIIYVKKQNDFERRIVELGISDARFIAITKGLNEAEEVALARPLNMVPKTKKKKRTYGND
jgi:HlyD family secretion protein